MCWIEKYEQNAERCNKTEEPQNKRNLFNLYNEARGLRNTKQKCNRVTVNNES